MSWFDKIIIAASLVLAGHAQAHGRVKHHVVRHVRYHHAGRSGPAPYCPAPLPGVLCEHESGRAIDQPHANAPRQDGSNSSYWQAERELRARLSGHPQERLPEAAIEYAVLKSRAAIVALVVQSAQAHDVPPALALGVIRVESNFNCRVHAADHRSVGLGQVLPETARAMGVSGDQRICANSLEAAMRYLHAAVAAFGPTCAAVSAYNRGIKRLPRCTAYGRLVLHFAKRMG